MKKVLCFLLLILLLSSCCIVNAVDINFVNFPSDVQAVSDKIVSYYYDKLSGNTEKRYYLYYNSPDSEYILYELSEGMDMSIRLSDLEVFFTYSNNSILTKYHFHTNGVYKKTTSIDFRFQASGFTGRHPTRIVCSSFDIYFDTGDVFRPLYNVFVFREPYISSESKLTTLKEDYILVHVGNLDVSVTDLNFIIREKKTIQFETGSYNKLEVVYNTVLNVNSVYYHSGYVSNSFVEWFEILNVDIKSSHEFKSGSVYIFSLEYVNSVGESKYIDYEVTMTAQNSSDFLEEGLLNLEVTISESNQKLLDAERETQAAIVEQTEVNKGILSTIGNILSYINPFSENFFAYKLVELFLEGLKGLFVPSEDYFSNLFDELNEYFSERFGILYLPFYLLENFVEGLHNALNIDSEPIIHVPNVELLGTILITSFDFNFNALLVNDTFKTVHDIYLIVVDSIIAFLLLRLAKRTFNEL